MTVEINFQLVMQSQSFHVALGKHIKYKLQNHLLARGICILGMLRGTHSGAGCIDFLLIQQGAKPG